MINLGVKSTLDRVSKAFDDMAKKQVPYATSVALNKTAVMAANELKNTMRSVFDRPTPWELNSLFVKYSTKTNLVARVEHKDSGQSVTPSLPLKAEIEGGSRRQKRSEILVSKVLGRSVYMEPSQYVQLDAYGNVSGPLMVKILSTIKAFNEDGYRANLTDKSKARQVKKGVYQDYYVVPFNNPRGTKPGVYLRQGSGKQVPIMFFVTSPPKYRERYDMQAVVSRVVNDNFGEQFATAMDQALGTAKIKL